MLIECKWGCNWIKTYLNWKTGLKPEFPVQVLPGIRPMLGLLYWTLKNKRMHEFRFLCDCNVATMWLTLKKQPIKPFWWTDKFLNPNEWSFPDRSILKALLSIWWYINSNIFAPISFGKWDITWTLAYELYLTFAGWCIRIGTPTLAILWTKSPCIRGTFYSLISSLSFPPSFDYFQGRAIKCTKSNLINKRYQNTFTYN